MILYNITYTVAHSVEDDFVSWMKGTHIPEVFACGLFTDHKFYRLLNSSDDESTNYSIQFFAESTAKLMEYEKLYAQDLRIKPQIRFGEKALAFRTLLQEV